MFKEKHERFLELIIAYYNCKENWLENGTRERTIAYRKVLKELSRLSKEMSDIVMEAQHERWRENKEMRKNTGTYVTKRRPKV
jgi:hypothetical protein